MATEERIACCNEDWRKESLHVQCSKCRGWFHQACTESPELKEILPFTIAYQFKCKACGGEKFERVEGTHKTLMLTVLANLALQQGSDTYFSFNEDIVPFVKANWRVLWEDGKAENPRWVVFAQKALLSMEKQIQVSDAANRSATSLFRLDPALLSDMTKFSPLANGILPTATKSKVDSSGPSSSSSSKKQRKDVAEHSSNASQPPFNKDGYRYTHAEVNPFGTEEFSYRASVFYEPPTLSLHDRAPQLKVGEDRLTVTGEKGYAMIRASHGVWKGKWYYEVTINDPERVSIDNSSVSTAPIPHVRVGWAQRYGNVQYPCGYDSFSYSWRDEPSSKFHKSKGEPYGEQYGVGDVLGLCIDLSPSAVLPEPLVKHGDKLIEYKSRLYFETQDHVSKMTQTFSPMSSISAYKNGVCQGIMFEGLMEGTYFPAVSLYMGAKVTFNFGPNFNYPLPFGYSPVSECVFEYNAAAILNELLAKVVSKIES